MRRIACNTVMFFLCTCFFYADAQTEGKVLFKRPEEYNMPREGQEILKSSQEHPTTSTWQVYSDRDDNPTYILPDLGSQKVKSLSFMDVFYVIEEKDNFLHIFKKDFSALVPGKKNKSASEIKAGYDDHDYGWVPKEKVLLWSNSLVNEYKFSIKALPILKNAEAFKNPEKYIKKGGTVYLYNSPDNPKINDVAVKMFQFLYVYKYDNKKALIGKSPEGDPAGCILGWIDTNIVQVWRLSICIWPNANDDAIIERQKNNIKASLFVNRDDAYSWSTRSGNPNPVWSNDKYDNKTLADVKRMPVISTDPNGVIITGNVTDVLEQSGEKIQDAGDKAALDARQGKLREKIRTINLVFVIDGSQAFLPSFPAIKQGIRDIATNPNRVNSDYHNQIQYSAVVYRNGKDKDCPNGDLSFGVMTRFSKNWSDVSDFLDQQSKISGCSSPDNSGAEAMYTGLEKGLRLLGDQTDNQSNVIIVIGGAGDNTDNQRESKLADLVAASKAGVIAYQLTHTKQPSFDNFKTQLVRIIKAGNTTVGEQIKKDNPDKSKQLNANTWGVWTELASGSNGDTRYFLDYPNTSPLLGAIIYPRIMQSMKQEDLPVVINKTMDTIDNIIEHNLEKFSASLNGVGNNKEEIKLNPTLLRYFDALGENGGTTSKDVINKYIEGGYQFFITGYTTPQVDKLKNPVFSLVIFASVQEYQNLEEAYRNLALNSATSSELRNALCDAMNQIVATYIGDKRAKEEITKMTPDDLQNFITGFKSNNPLLTKHTIADYKDSRKVPDDEVKALEKNFDAVENKLRKIRSDPNYTFKQGDDYFYWLPDNILTTEGGGNKLITPL